MKTDGSQKAARLRRLRAEIIRYVEANPGCSAAQIVSSLCCDRGMKNHGLTPRKIGFIIPRICADVITHQMDKSSGKRIYLPKPKME